MKKNLYDIILKGKFKKQYLNTVPKFYAQKIPLERQNGPSLSPSDNCQCCQLALITAILANNYHTQSTSSLIVIITTQLNIQVPCTIFLITWRWSVLFQQKARQTLKHVNYEVHFFGFK